MRVASCSALYALLVLTAAARAQSPTPAPRPAPPAKLDPNSPAQAGRTQLNAYLNSLAATDEAARREAIARITTRAQAAARQAEVRHRLLQLLGGGLENPSPLHPRVTGSTPMEGFRIEKVLFDSQPNFPVTALLYLPEAPSSSAESTKLPAIVMAPGHSAAGKASDFALASIFARNGFAVLSYDPIGQGERLQYPDPGHPGKSLATGSTGEHAEAALQPTLIGDAVSRYFIQDGMRAVDYLLTRPEVDPGRIGAFGCSGGGVMTAMLGAADRRIRAIATACYITSMDTLLPTLGPQDAEQSIPGFISAGLDFPDWVELAAPRPYALVGTVSDMFPWAGFLTSATEARRFYALFDPSAAGTPTGNPPPPTPTGPTLNPDTPNTIAPTAPLQVIAGIGGHGNLRPLYSQIVSFFLVNLAHSTAEPIVPPAPAPGAPRTAPAPPSAELQAAMQVTPTGQVATSFPGAATVYTLNLARAKQKIPEFTAPQTLLQVQTAIREVTNAEAAPGTPPAVTIGPDSSPTAPKTALATLTSAPGITLQAYLYSSGKPGRHPAVLQLTDDLSAPPSSPQERAHQAGVVLDAVQNGAVAMVFTPRPSPPGVEETKSPILGPFYMAQLRSEQVGTTLLGMRVDDVIRAVDYLASRPDVDPGNIAAVATGHMGLVLLHAAVLDPRLKHIAIDHTLKSYRALLDTPMPIDAPQDILPGVLLKYDIPDLVRVLGPRLTATDWLP